MSRRLNESESRIVAADKAAVAVDDRRIVVMLAVLMDPREEAAVVNELEVLIGRVIAARPRSPMTMVLMKPLLSKLPISHSNNNNNNLRVLSNIEIGLLSSSPSRLLIVVLLIRTNRAHKQHQTQQTHTTAHSRPRNNSATR